MKKIKFKALLMMVMIFTLVSFSFSEGQQVQSVIDFSSVDIEGNKITLSDFDDKVVLLDFWATWCGPCRREIPNLIELKKTFKDNDFEIISIALERGTEDAVINFIKKNQMKWVHIVKKESAMELAKKYKIMYIPTMFLIKDGKIVATGLHGEALKNKIKQLI